MWTHVWKRWMDMIFWWLPKPQETRSQETTHEEAAPKETAPGKTAPRDEGAAQGGSAPAESQQAGSHQAAGAPAGSTSGAGERAGGAAATAASSAASGAAPAAAATDSGPDDLTTIKGIGPAMQDKLRALGLNTYRDLAAADAEALAQQLKATQRTITAKQVRGWIQAAREQT